MGHSPLETILQIITGGLELILNELERTRIIVIPNREHPLQHSLQPDIKPYFWPGSRLEEIFERTLLNLDKIWKINDLSNLGEVPSHEGMENIRMLSPAHMFSSLWLGNSSSTLSPP